MARSSSAVDAPVLAVLGIALGGIVAVQGFAILNMLGMGPLTAVVASFATTREFAPILAGIGFAAQAGCRMTAEIGAMRINEEIDALESLGLRSISFVVTTRVIAGLIAVVPVYLITLILSWGSCAWLVTSVYSMPTGTYDHYFSQFISAKDIVFSVIKVAVFLVAVIIIHCYQGFFASGGPGGRGYGIRPRHPCQLVSPRRPRPRHDRRPVGHQLPGRVQGVAQWESYPYQVWPWTGRSSAGAGSSPSS